MNRPDYKKIREAKEISLKSIFEESRISVSNLEAIENGDYKVLPAHFISRAFIKSYAQGVSIDPQGLLDEYEEFLRQIDAAANYKEEDVRKAFVKQSLQRLMVLAKQNKKMLLRLGVVGVGIIALLLLAVTLSAFISYLFTPAKAPTSSSANDTAVERVLQIKASDKAVVRIKRDEQPTTEFTLLPGESLEQKAKEVFIVEISNAGAVRVVFQGQDIGVLGRLGEKVRLVLPPHLAGVTTSAVASGVSGGGGAALAPLAPKNTKRAAEVAATKPSWKAPAKKKVYKLGENTGTPAPPAALAVNSDSFRPTPNPIVGGASPHPTTTPTPKEKKTTSAFPSLFPNKEQP